MEQPGLHRTGGDLEDGGELYSRMFGPSFGIPEDPATGSAAGILAGVAAGFASPASDRYALSIRQGVAMGRPSRLDAAALLENGKVTAIEVGGAVTFIAEGKIDIPAAYWAP